MVMDPIQPVQGQAVTIEITVKNQGQVAAGKYWLFCFRHLDAPPVPGPEHFSNPDAIGSWLPEIAPSATISVTFPFGYYDTVGDFNVYALVDAMSEVDESIEDNNVYGPYGIHVAKGCVGALSTLGRWCWSGNGTVLDMRTGLVWLEDASCMGSMTWDDALRLPPTTLQEGLCSRPILIDGSALGDWRLPSFRELITITRDDWDEYIRNTSIYFFSNVQPGEYWTRSLTGSLAGDAFTVEMATGHLISGYTETEVNYVWPVRGHMEETSSTTTTVTPGMCEAYGASNCLETPESCCDSSYMNYCCCETKDGYQCRPESHCEIYYGGYVCKTD
jgi:hypothetical protein